MTLRQHIARTFFAASLLCAASISARGFASEPQWIFNNGSGVERIAVAQGEFVKDLGLVKFKVQGEDFSIAPSIDDGGFYAGAYPFLAIRYRAENIGDKGGLFFTNDKDAPTLSDKTYSEFAIEANGEWQNLVVDMRKFEHGNWTGKITSIRLDLSNPSVPGTEIELSRVGFFATEKDARKFLDAAKDVVAKAPVWILNNGGDVERQSVGGGKSRSLFGLFEMEATGHDVTVSPMMTSAETFEAQTRPFFAVRYKAQTKREIGGIFFTNEKLTTLSDESFTSFPIVGDGTWQNLVVDMREEPKKVWNGTITSMRLDLPNPSDRGTVISLSRYGFFPTKEEANAFLAAANDLPDYNLSGVFKNEIVECVIPPGVGSASMSLDALIVDHDAAIKTAEHADPEDELVVRQSGKIAPFSDATSMGYVSYRAIGAGKAELCVVKPTATDVDSLADPDAARFVLARGLMKNGSDGAFNPIGKVGGSEVDALREALAAGTPAKLDDESQKLLLIAETAQQEGATREELAKRLKRAVKETLGMAVDTAYDKDYFTRDRIRLGAWGNFNSAHFDDKYMKTYAETGFDFLLAFVNAPTGQILSLGDKYGVEVVLNDSSYLDPINSMRESCDHPSFAGCYVVDEPGSDAFPALSEKCNAYRKATGKLPYVNLLPMYANAAQLKFGAGAAAIEYYDPDPELFEKYCDAFCQQFDVDYICTDIYPLNWKNGAKFTYPEYVESIDVIASVARKRQRDFWCFIQTFGWIPSKRTPVEEEFRWQCYTLLSFGCKTFLCWDYCGSAGFPSLVDERGEQTPAWYAARNVMHELRALSDEFICYRNLGAFSYSKGKIPPYLEFANQYEDFKAIEEIDSDSPLLFGCFERKDDATKRAFTIVNMEEFEGESGATARVKLAAEKVVVWERGVPRVLHCDEDGFRTFHLASGEGVFVTLE